MVSLNPVLLTEKSTQKLPRPLLLCMLVAYALSGLIGKDPWRGNDAIGFGMALSFSQNWGVDSLQTVAGASIAEHGPLWFAIVGVFIRGLSFLPAHIAAAIPVALSLLLAAYALWYATYYIAKTPAAQPLTLALGGQPQPIAYARAVADGAVLLLLATLGVALPLHEITALSFQFVLLSLLLMGASLSLYAATQRQATLVMAFTMFVLGASVGLHAICTAGLWLILVSRLTSWNNLHRALPWLALSAGLGFSLPFVWAWSLGQLTYAQALWAWNLAQFSWIESDRLRWLLSNGAFITWPALPFAVAAVWRWRKRWQAPHIWLGLSFITVFLCSQLIRTEVTDDTLMAIVPGALLLAAFLLPALPRIWMNAMDWFGVMALSFVAVLFWLMWLAMTTGIPAPLARNILRLAPNLDTSVRWIGLGAAVIATVFWILVVRWRVLAAKTVVWRAAVIWSAGSLTVWVLIGSLFMPWLNHVKTYKPLGIALKHVLHNQHTCISPLRIGLPQRAVLAYFGEINFEPQSLHVETDEAAEDAPIDTPATVACDWILEYSSLQALSDMERLPYLPEGSWTLRWEGRRFIEKDERFRLYQRERKPIHLRLGSVK